MSVKDALPTVRSGFTAGVRAAARTSERTDSQGNGPGADAREPTRPTADEAAKASRRGTDGLSHTRGPGCLTAEGGGGGRTQPARHTHARKEGPAGTGLLSRATPTLWGRTVAAAAQTREHTKAHGLAHSKRMNFKICNCMSVQQN